MMSRSAAMAMGGVLVFAAVASGQCEWLTIDGDMILTPQDQIVIDITGYTATGPGYTEYDVIEVNGNVQLDGTLSLLFADGFVPVPGSTFDIIRYTGVLSGDFDQLTGKHTEYYIRGIDYAWDMGNGSTAVRVEACPEPATLSLLTIGGLAVLRRRRR